MGLDVYVGTLTRYYAGDWELVAQQASREMGLDVQVVREHNPADAIRDPEELRPLVTRWRESLSAALQGDLGCHLDWREDDSAPYATDKPTWDCYSDLLLWAAYSESPDLKRPVQHVDPSGDAAYQRVSRSDARIRYSHLYDVELWLPCKFGFVFRADDICGNELLIGSSLQLAEQLRQLNENTWAADPDTLKTWSREGADNGAPLEDGARFAFAVFSELARFSVEQSLPMRLDY